MKQKLSAFPWGSKRLREVGALILSYGGTLALSYALGSALCFSDGVLSLFFFGALTVVFLRSFGVKARGLFWYTWIPALLISAFFMIGARLETGLQVHWKSIRLYLAIILLSLAIKAILVLCYTGLNRLHESRASEACRIPDETSGLADWFTHTPYWRPLTMAVLLIAWLPTWLALWPGAFIYDTYGQWIQLSSGKLLQTSPLMHTLLLGGLLELGQKLFDSYAIGGAVYAALQMLLLVGCFTLSLGVLRRLRIPFWGQMAFLLFYALYPVVQVFSVTAVKDVLFSGFALTASLYLFMLVSQPRSGSRKDLIAAAVFCFLACSFRNGAIWLVIAVLVILWLLVSNRRRQLFFVGLVASLLMVVWSGVCTYGFNAEKGSSKELLSVPVTQLVNVYRQHEDEMDAEDRRSIEDCFTFSEDLVAELYKPDCADYPKHCLKEEKVSSFLRIWLKMGARYPTSYMDAFFRLTHKAWYPTSVINGYCTGSGQFDTETCYFQLNDINEPIAIQSKLPGLYRLYYTFGTEISFQKYPVVSALLSPGLTLWLLIVTVCFLCWKRSFKATIPLLLPLIWHVVYIFSPVVLVRYFLLSYFAAPLCILAMAFPGKFSSSSIENPGCDEKVPHRCLTVFDR